MPFLKCGTEQNDGGLGRIFAVFAPNRSVVREATLKELKRLALILWRVHKKQAISQEDRQSVYNSLFGRTVLVSRQIAPRAIVQAICEATADFEFTLDTVKQLLPAVPVQQPATVLQ